MNRFGKRRWMSSAALLFAPAFLASCASLGSSGPSTKSINNVKIDESGILLIDLDERVAREVFQNRPQKRFDEVFGSKVTADRQIVGLGDILDIAIWEAPPAALFGTSAGSSQLSSSMTTISDVARSAGIPQQMVDSSGQIVVPFVGAVTVVGRTPRQIAQQITSSLASKAHKPQVIVRIADNKAANVTVVGEVSKSGLVPLTTKGERLLDVLGAVGGVKQQVDKVTIQLSRGGVVASDALINVINDPSQNVILQASDIVTALYQPYSFQALGAFNTNSEVNFEATGLTLAQALGRIGGLQDNRANVRGVFIFRFEDPAVLGGRVTSATRITPDGRVAVIYRIDMSSPSVFFIAQGFRIQNSDILYVSNAPLIDIQKFVNVLFSTAFSVVSIGNAAR